MSAKKYNSLKNISGKNNKTIDAKESANDFNSFISSAYKASIVLNGTESDETLKALLSSENLDNIVFSNCFLDEAFYKKVASFIDGKNIKVLFSVAEEGENSDCIFNERQTKTLADNVNIFLALGTQTEIYSKFNGQTYSLDKVLEANRKLSEWAKLINSARVDGRELSPLEKYLYAFITVSNYYEYSMENADESPSVSRALVNVLTGDKIVCVGFAEMLSSVLNMVGVPCIKASVFMESAKTGHAVCLPYINDSLYNCNGIVYSDPTSKNLAYSMIALKDFASVFSNISFVQNGLGSDGKRTLLNDYLQKLKNLPKEDLDILTKLIQESKSEPEVLTFEEIGEENYQTFNDIIKKVLEDKKLSELEVNFVMKYNFPNIDAFKAEVYRHSKLTTVQNQKNFREVILDHILHNTQRAVYRHKHTRDDTLTKLSGTADFSQEALVNVFRSMGKPELVARKFTSAFIAKAIEELCKSEEYVHPMYKLNLKAPTTNFFIQRLKELQQATKTQQIPITFEEASKAYYEARIDYKLGKISKESFEDIEKMYDEKIEVEDDAQNAKTFIKEELNKKVMDKGSGKE